MTPELGFRGRWGGFFLGMFFMPAIFNPVPEMPDTPDGLPTTCNEITEVIALLSGRGDGFSQRYRVLVECAGKVQELVRKLA